MHSEFSIPRVDCPFVLFGEWFTAAKGSEPKYPDAVTMATIGLDGIPSARTVLLKEWDDRGFVIYTNLEGGKGREVAANGRAALCFYWKTLDRQVRIRGAMEQVSDEQADAYFATRPRESRIGAWASRQSQEISGREELMARVEDFERRFADGEVPRPPHWSGLRLVPVSMEFWSEGTYRLHDRLVYTREGDGWRTAILSP